MLDSVLLVEQRALRCGPCSPRAQDPLSQTERGAEAWLRLEAGPCAFFRAGPIDRRQLGREDIAQAGKQADLIGESAEGGA